MKPEVMYICDYCKGHIRNIDAMISYRALGLASSDEDELLIQKLLGKNFPRRDESSVAAAQVVLNPLEHHFCSGKCLGAYIDRALEET